MLIILVSLLFACGLAASDLGVYEIHSAQDDIALYIAGEDPHQPLEAHLRQRERLIDLFLEEHSSSPEERQQLADVLKQSFADPHEISQVLDAWRARDQQAAMHAIEGSSKKFGIFCCLTGTTITLAALAVVKFFVLGV